MSNAESEAPPPHSQLLPLARFVTLSNKRIPTELAGVRAGRVVLMETCESSRHSARAQQMHLVSLPVSHTASLLANHPSTTLGARQKGSRGLRVTEQMRGRDGTDARWGPSPSGRLLLPPSFLQTTEAATMNQATEHLHREGQMPSWESRAKLLQSYLTLQPHRLEPAKLLCPWISQARILAWVVIPFSRGSSRPGDQTRFSGVSCTGRRILNH